MKMAPSKRRVVFEKTSGRCWYCGSGIDLETMCVEHATPKSKGGRNEIDNLLPACRSCNSQKYTKTVEEYRTWIEWFQAGSEPFTQNQIEWLASHGIVLPDRPRHLFWAERQ